FSHITDFAGYDHMLFVVGLCAVYRPSEWKKVGLLITAFTVGHCVTLLLAGRYGNFIEANTIEQLVALSIFLGGLYNLVFPLDWHRQKSGPVYLLVIGFGLLHGLAFSNFFRALGSEPDTIWKELLAFNIGVEVGQLMIVCWFFVLYLVLQNIAVHFFGQDEAGKERFHGYWYRLVSIGVMATGAYLVVERLG
ncbi:MAG: HupE/UreJ family protein, partial [Bacteroidota bacterium]